MELTVATNRDEHATMKGILQRRRPAAQVLALLVLAAVAFRGYRATAEDAHVLPPPVADVRPGQSTSAVAVLAGGCFWGVQAVFQHVKGVTNAVSGYAGGNKRTANYEIVSTGTTGHAESVQVTYDPRVISYGRLLQIFFSVAHDPTELNRQGPDTGTQYRSAIFTANSEQAEVAKAYIAQLDQARVFKKAIVTKIEPDRAFYPAEAYHQDFLTQHPTHPYIVANDLPKVEDLKRLFADVYRGAPVLVAGMHGPK
jgi:peptide-methionine (S)-S-oxide reductase